MTEELITLRIRKRTFLISLIVLLVTVAITFFLLTKKKVENLQEAEKGKKETEELMKKMKEKFITFHIKHTIKKIIYDKNCEVCRGLWKD